MAYKWPGYESLRWEKIKRICVDDKRNTNYNKDDFTMKIIHGGKNTTNFWFNNFTERQ